MEILMTEVTTQETQEVPAQEPQAQEPQVQESPQGQPGLTINDLLTVLNIIQVVSQRGVIRADEMSTVGNLYDRLFKFLDAQGAIKRPEPAATSEATN